MEKTMILPDKRPAVSIKTAPGKILIVAVYTQSVRGAATRGTRASMQASKENSEQEFFWDSLERIERIVTLVQSLRTAKATAR